MVLGHRCVDDRPREIVIWNCCMIKNSRAKTPAILRNSERYETSQLDLAAAAVEICRDHSPGGDDQENEKCASS